MEDIQPIKGVCKNMCPDEEMKWRERNNLLHPFEIKTGTDRTPKADPSKVVKQFSRSAAGKKQASASDLRPAPVLLSTMNYLIEVIVPNKNVPWITVYDFINDRIQAVRQDLTIQMISDLNAVQIYEKCVKFYVLARYVLCEEPQIVFDPHLNNQQFLICLDKLFSLYKIFKRNCMYEFVAINYAVNVHNAETFYRSVSVFSDFMSNHIVKLSIKTCISCIEGNFIQFFKLVKRLPIILMLSFFYKFRDMRKQALNVMSVAYSSNQNKFPADLLCNWLCLDTKNDGLHLCELYKVKTDSNFIYFSKTQFDSNVNIPYKKESLLNSKLMNISWSELINAIDS